MSNYELHWDFLEEIRANIDAVARAEFLQRVQHQYDEGFRGERHLLTLQLEWNEAERAWIEKKGNES